MVGDVACVGHLSRAELRGGLICAHLCRTVVCGELVCNSAIVVSTVQVEAPRAPGLATIRVAGAGLVVWLGSGLGLGLG